MRPLATLDAKISDSPSGASASPEPALAAKQGGLANSGLGFRRSGEIRGSSLRFTIGGDTYSVNTTGRIAPGDAAFDLYVLHQPKWRPGYPDADLDAATVGAADRVEDLVSR